MERSGYGIDRSPSAPSGRGGSTGVGRWLAILLAIGSLCGAPSIASETIRNVPPTPHGVAEGTPLEVIEEAIVQAAGERQWYGSVETPGLIVVSTTIRKHRATVEIGVDASRFWINYRDSSNLDFNPNDLTGWDQDGASRSRVVRKKGPRIHPNYNEWVEELARHIGARTNAIVLTEKTATAGCDQRSVADELEKLDRLRQRGVLTQEEFDGQKRKLLAQ